MTNRAERRLRTRKSPAARAVVEQLQAAGRDVRDAQRNVDRLAARLPKWPLLQGAGHSAGAALEGKYAFINALDTAFVSSEPDSIIRTVVHDSLMAAEPYLIAAGTHRLIEDAARQLPNEMVLSATDMPADAGIMLFERNALDGRCEMLSWTRIHIGEDDSDGVLFIDYTDRRDGSAMPFGASYWGAGWPLDAFDEVDPHDNGKRAWATNEYITDVRRFFMAFCYFVQQRVLASSSERADRAARKRLATSGYEADSAVQIVKLRAAEQHVHEVSEGRDVEWQSRWIVRGHWRQQPYGEGRSLVHPVWIAPYVKGPDGLPVKVRTRLFEVAR